jgi:hypothetical protein
MASMTTFNQNALLNTQRGVTYTGLANVYLGLFSAAPTMPAGTGGTELTSGTAPGYARIAVPAASLGAASGGIILNTSVITMAAATGAWPAAIWLGLWDALTVGNLLWAGVLAGVNDVQTLTTTGVPTGGTFTLTFGGQTTPAIPYNATATAIEEFLEGLTSIGDGNVACTGGPLPTGVVCTFIGTLANASQTLMTHADSLTGGSTPAVVNTHTTTGASGTKTLGSTDVFSIPIGSLSLQVA